MTLAERVVKHLYDNGLFLDQANAVLAAMKADLVLDSMQQRWDDQEEGYPEPMMRVLCVSANRAAVLWIDANCPRHWARGMFDLTTPAGAVLDRGEEESDMEGDRR